MKWIYKVLTVILTIAIVVCIIAGLFLLNGSRSQEHYMEVNEVMCGRDALQYLQPTFEEARDALERVHRSAEQGDRVWYDEMMSAQNNVSAASGALMMAYECVNKGELPKSDEERPEGYRMLHEWQDYLGLQMEALGFLNEEDYWKQLESENPGKEVTADLEKLNRQNAKAPAGFAERVGKMLEVTDGYLRAFEESGMTPEEIDRMDWSHETRELTVARPILEKVLRVVERYQSTLQWSEQHLNNH